MNRIVYVAPMLLMCSGIFPTKTVPMNQDVLESSGAKAVTHVQWTPDSLRLNRTEVAGAECQPLNRWGTVLKDACGFKSLDTSIAMVTVVDSQHVAVQAIGAGNTGVRAGANQMADTLWVQVEDTTSVPPDTTTPPDTMPSTVAGCPASGYLRLVNVSDTTQLKQAFATVLPGDQIRLAPGTYKGFRKIIRSGTAANPWTLCGPRTANIGGTGVNPAPINLNIHASYFVLQGFTMRKTFQPIFVIGGKHWVIKNLEIDSTGNSGIAAKLYSTHWLIDSNYIHNTGLTEPVYGEGIYIGTASAKWCAQNGCKPDKSDSGTISHNVVGPGIGSQMIDIKDGVTGTRVIANRYNGAGRRDTTSGSWAVIVGNWTFDSANVGINPTTSNKFPNGYYIEQVALLNGASPEGGPWGRYNKFMFDTLSGSGAPGKGFLVGGGPKPYTTIKCSNKVSGFALYSNMSPTCQP